MTALSVVIAAASLAGAISMRPVDIEVKPFEDTGTALFPDFDDPAKAASLEVIAWDEDEARYITFKVEQKDGSWVIPSHNDYPADGTEHMGKAASSFIDVKKDIVQSDRPEDHAAFGVIDPEEGEGKGEGTGQHILIKDASGTPLVDVIVGDDVPNKDGFRYLRLPGEKRVYASRIKLEVSTDFTDWIEDDLLLLEKDDIVTVISDAYTVDEAAGQVTGRDPLVAELGKDPADPESTEDWREKPVEGQAPLPGKVLDPLVVKRVIGAADRLKIVGVRPRPQVLTLQALQSKGFFVTQDGRRLFGNEGELKLANKDGVVYTLYFGEVAEGTGRALTAGVEDPKAPKPAEGDDPLAEKQSSRYMFVDVNYDPAVDKTLAVAEGATPPAPEESEGYKRTEKLRQRFDQWFYVISDDSFQQMRKTRADYFKDAPAEKKDDKTG
ncbi:MAG: DUF4340 domain-containing protein [Myxococcales bacterium]|nr:DUF4340 domain-containing protein [Myxococcales bacterium]